MKFTETELDIITNALDEFYRNEEDKAARISQQGLDGRYFMLDAAKAQTVSDRIKKGRVNY